MMTDKMFLYIISGLFHFILCYILLYRLKTNMRVHKKYTRIFFALTITLNSIQYCIFKNNVVFVSLYVLAVFVVLYMFNKTVKRFFVCFCYLGVISIVTYLTASLVMYITGFFIANNIVNKIMLMPSIQLMITIVICKIRNGENHKHNILSWIMSVLHPISTIVLIYVLTEFCVMPEIDIYLVYFLFFILNVILVMIYYNQMDWLDAMYQKRHEMTQKKYFGRDLDILYESLDTLRAERHDYIKHLSMVKYMLMEKQYDNLLPYMDDIIENASLQKCFVSTGSAVMDVILNHILQDADENNIKFNHHILLACIDEVSTYDMTTIIFNLLDNSFDAVKKVDDRWINFNVNYDRGRIFIEVENPYDGREKAKDAWMISDKKYPEEHGFGLKNVEKIVDKYNGVMDIHTDNNVFKVKILVYLEMDGDKNAK